MRTYQNQFHNGNSRMTGCRCTPSSDFNPGSGEPRSCTNCADACSRQDPLHALPIAMAYVPWQTWRQIYEAETGFLKGTIFQELDKPFFGKGGCRK